MLCSEAPVDIKELSVFYRRDRPGMPAFTVALVILWLLLAGYILLHPDPVGIIILAVMAVFIAGPALFVALGTRRMRREQENGEPMAHASGTQYDSYGDNGHNRHDGHDGHDGLTGHSSDGASGGYGVQQRATGEIPDEGGDNP